MSCNSDNNFDDLVRSKSVTLFLSDVLSLTMVRTRFINPLRACALAKPYTRSFWLDRNGVIAVLIANLRNYFSLPNYQNA